ncbi:MAG TPA: TlpA disulfide reductase family protein [Pyrinomonadaceae bacterium]|nr:TlpA disulfide reductase family protein [Pyrinomonadaceae bacterium]
MPPLGGSLNALGWTDHGGNRSVFSDFRGKVLVLDFYATWCGPCRLSTPHLVGLQEKFGAQGLQVIGLNVGGPNDPPKVPAFAKEFGIQYPLAIPDDDLVMFLMGDNNAIPQTFVFDRQGKLVERLTGFGPSSGEIIDEAVAAALQTPAP